MNNFNLELFNMALNFGDNDRYYPENIISSMGEIILRSRTITGKSDNIIRIEFLLLSGNIISVKRLARGKFKATVKPAFPVAPKCVERQENIFGECWIPFTDDILLCIEDKIRLLDGRVNEVATTYSDGSFTIYSSDEILHRSCIKEIWR